MTKALTFQAPPPQEEKTHQWEVERWVSTPSKICKVCGVEETTGSTKTLGIAGKYTYRDASGNSLSTLEPLTRCPTYIGSVAGTLAETKQRSLRQKGQIETIEDRLARLEADNQALREKLEKKIDAQAFVEWLSQMAQLHAQQQLPSIPAQVGEKVVSLPAPVAEVITLIGVEVEGREVFVAETPSEGSHIIRIPESE